MSKVQIRFDAPPGPESGRFIEAENEDGEGIDLGMWKPDGDDWLLVFDLEYNESDWTDGFLNGFLIGFVGAVIILAVVGIVIVLKSSGC